MRAMSWLVTVLVLGSVVVMGCAPTSGEDEFAVAAAVTFSLPEGDYGTDQVVHLSTDEPEAVIYYSTDGSEPQVESAFRYRGPVAVRGHGTRMQIRAIAAVAGRTPSAAVSARYNIWYFAQTTAPRIAPLQGVYSQDQMVTIATPTEGALIYYTLDGSVPHPRSMRYTEPFELAGDGASVHVRAIAYQIDMTPSDVSSSDIVIDYAALDPPVLSPAAGTYAEDQHVSISAAQGAEIHYTLDGSAPTSASPRYTGPITLRGDDSQLSVRAVAFIDGMKGSSVAEASYAIAYAPADTPTLSPAPGSYNGVVWIELTSADASATYHYTVDGSEPTTASPQYVGRFAVQGPTEVEVKAIAIRDGRRVSAIGGGAYSISYDVVSEVVMSPPGGVFTAGQTVTLSTATPGAEISYTLSTDSGERRLRYKAPIEIPGADGTHVTIRAQATKDGLVSSSFRSESYAVTWDAVATPVITPDGSDYDEDAPPVVSISTVTPGATLYVSVGGDAWSLYTGPFALTRSASVTAMASKAGMRESAKRSETFRVTQYLYVSALADEEGADGSIASPFLSPADAAAAAVERGGDHHIRVAGGDYELTAPLVLNPRTSLFGGYDDVDWSRDIATHPTVITHQDAAPDALVVLAAGATEHTVVDGVELEVAANGGATAVLLSEGGSPMIRRTRIAAHGASAADLTGIVSRYGSPSLMDVEVTLTEPGNAVGVLLRGEGSPVVYNCVIDVGDETTDHNFGIAYGAGTNATIVNNTIHFGGAAIAAGVGSWLATQGWAAPIIQSNLIWSKGAGDGVCIHFEEAFTPALMASNNLFDCGAALLDDGIDQMTSEIDINALQYAADNLSFDLTDGANTYFVDEASDWRLRDGGPAGFAAVKTGGRDGYPIFGETVDHDGNDRTGDDILGWSIGAFENDN